ncbi:MULTISPECIES: hypothetical protein [unclassified Ensifer]|uniref:hypothetical protein n=1 Tax=unclassified Ensifer TaxID=2633371 RepID=UPI001FCD3970|nr:MULTISPECIES: hypothetical protein [unclassified Ensifer]
MVAFLRDYVRILAYCLSAGPFPRLTQIIVAIGLAVSGPGILYTAIEAMITGEVRSRGAVIATAKEQPFEFYTVALIHGLGAAFLTVLFGAAFLFLLFKGRASRRG